MFMMICIYGASSQALHPDYFSAAEALGREMAARGHGLVFGGGARGLMGACARGAHSGGGEIVGVAPRFFDVDGILYPHCTRFVYTDTMRQRKEILENESDAFAVLPGGVGTFDEFFEILTLKQLGRHGKPIALLNTRGYFDPLLALLDRAIADGFLKAACRELYGVFSDPAALLTYLETAPQGLSDPLRMKNIAGLGGEPV